MSYIVKELDDLKGLIKSISTSTEAPEEVLESLQGMGIESYVTEEGDLMIRYWQVGAESFFPPEQAAIIRTKRPSPENSDKLDWLSKNLQRIRQNMLVNGLLLLTMKSSLLLQPYLTS